VGERDGNCDEFLDNHIKTQKADKRFFMFVNRIQQTCEARLDGDKLPQSWRRWKIMGKWGVKRLILLGGPGQCAKGGRQADRELKARVSSQEESKQARKNSCLEGEHRRRSRKEHPLDAKAVISNSGTRNVTERPIAFHERHQAAVNHSRGPGKGAVGRQGLPLSRWLHRAQARNCQRGRVSTILVSDIKPQIRR